MPAERSAFLDEACGGDDELRREVDALLAAHQDAAGFLSRPPAPDTGSLIGDVHALLEHLAELMHDPTLGRSIRMMVADGVANPELAAAHDEFVQFRRPGTKVVFERAIARGELRADTDVEVAADVLTAPLFYRHLVSHMPVDRAYARAVIDAFLRAYGTQTTS